MLLHTVYCQLMSDCWSFMSAVHFSIGNDVCIVLFVDNMNFYMSTNIFMRFEGV